MSHLEEHHDSAECGPRSGLLPMVESLKSSGLKLLFL